ncbi:hypothetical protein CCHL11_00849 [Colletotrichum chlorophyti]|uniref:AA1-like domain-containing protein n=1 Tax=Colletotrichum chlorophyti TaxID=708187 RepID=A0A1Q8S4Y6_9PEZI|nr:hypothetical protein CCHL11_00849 [Colletotrichum chlorophyti]
MKFTLATVAALFGASALAAPAPQASDAPLPSEKLTITDFYVRKQPNGTLTNVNFSLSGDDADAIVCNANNPGFPSKIFDCGETKYRFAVIQGSKTEYALRIYHELGTAVGFWGDGDVATYCHAGGLGDALCSPVEPETIITIDSVGHRDIL